MVLNALIPTSGVDVLTVPAGATYAVLLITVCNYSVSTRTVDIHVVPSGGSPGDLTKIISARSLAANDSLFLSTEKLILTAGDVIHLVASANAALNVLVSFYGL